MSIWIVVLFKTIPVCLCKPKSFVDSWKVSYLLGAGTADVRAKHNFVGSLAVHVGLLQLAVEHLEVTTSAVNVLLMFHGELHH